MQKRKPEGGLPAGKGFRAVAGVFSTRAGLILKAVGDRVPVYDGSMRFYGAAGAGLYWIIQRMLGSNRGAAKAH
jgi:hypothetical protein